MFGAAAETLLAGALRETEELEDVRERRLDHSELRADVITAECVLSDRRARDDDAVSAVDTCGVARALDRRDATRLVNRRLSQLERLTRLRELALVRGERVEDVRQLAEQVAIVCDAGDDHLLVTSECRVDCVTQRSRVQDRCEYYLAHTYRLSLLI